MKLDISPMLNAYPCSTPIWTVVFQLLTIP